MANFTKEAIKESFISLLEEMPLGDITVKTIVEACGINRNSFYYHFQDIPSLLDEIIKEDAETIICRYPSVTSIVQCFDALTEFASQHKRAIMHIYRSVNRESFETHLMSVSDYFIRRMMDSVLFPDKLSAADWEAVATYYKCVCFGLVIDWLNQGMSGEMLASLRRILLLKTERFEDVVEQLERKTN